MTIESSVNILVAESHAPSLSTITAILTHSDYNIVKAATASEVLDEIIRLDFAVILLDLMMPDFDGFELAARIRENKRSKDTPIIFMTTIKKDQSFIYKGCRDGFVDCITKPFDADMVRVKVSIFVALFRQNKEIADQTKTLQQNDAKALDLTRRKDEFLATISHELRTPLGAVLGWSELLMNSIKTHDEETAHALEVIHRNGQSLANLVDDLLDVSNIITGKLILNLNHHNLRPLVDSVYENLQPLMEKKSIKSVVYSHSNEDLILGDSNRLKQIIWNLLSNAIKFTPNQGMIHIEINRENKHVILKITDSGIGIDPNFLPHIFDRFQQADSTTTRKFGGLGLGLAIVHHLVELHNGTVTADSRGENQGSSFVVRFPVAQVTAIAENEGKDDLDSEISLLGLNVMIVDDDVDVRNLFSVILNSCGAEVHDYSNVSDAVHQLQKERPDVLISDIGMPNEDGYSLIKKVRALDAEQYAYTPAAALTAYASEEDRTKTINAGFDLHITKPVSPMDLIRAVAKLRDRSCAQSQKCEINQLTV